MRKLLSVLPLVAVLAAPAVMHADQISGQFSAAGSYVNDTNAQTLTFTNAFISPSAGDLYGSFQSILQPGEVIGANSLTLSYGNYNPSTPEVFTVYKTGTADPALTITLNDFQGVNSTVLGVPYFLGKGDVTFAAAGYDPTSGVLTFSSQPGSMPNVSFSATATTSPVPEPSTLALLGTGGLGLAGAIRRRFRA